MRSRCCRSSPRPRQPHLPRRPYVHARRSRPRRSSRRGSSVAVHTTPNRRGRRVDQMRIRGAGLGTTGLYPGSAGPGPGTRAADYHRVPGARLGRSWRLRPALPPGGLCPYLYHFAPADPEHGPAALDHVPRIGAYPVRPHADRSGRGGGPPRLYGLRRGRCGRGSVCGGRDAVLLLGRGGIDSTRGRGGRGRHIGVWPVAQEDAVPTMSGELILLAVAIAYSAAVAAVGRRLARPASVIAAITALAILVAVPLLP